MILLWNERTKYLINVVEPRPDCQFIQLNRKPVWLPVWLWNPLRKYKICQESVWTGKNWKNQWTGKIWFWKFSWQPNPEQSNSAFSPFALFHFHRKALSSFLKRLLGHTAQAEIATLTASALSSLLSLQKMGYICDSLFPGVMFNRHYYSNLIAVN